MGRSVLLSYKSYQFEKFDFVQLGEDKFLRTKKVARKGYGLSTSMGTAYTDPILTLSIIRWSCISVLTLLYSQANKLHPDLAGDQRCTPIVTCLPFHLLKYCLKSSEEIHNKAWLLKGLSATDRISFWVAVLKTLLIDQLFNFPPPHAVDIKTRN